MTTNTGHQLTAEQQKHRRPDGKFGSFQHDEPKIVDVLQDPFSNEGFVAFEKEFRSGLPETMDLIHVGCDEEMSDNQIDMLLDGRFDDLYDDVLDLYYDQECRTANMFAKEHCLDLGVDYDLFSQNRQAILRIAVMERDVSDPVRDRAHNTRQQLMRTSLPQARDEVYALSALAMVGNLVASDITGRHRQERVDAVANSLAAAGLDMTDKANQDAVADLVDNGPRDWHGGVRVEVLFTQRVPTVTPSEISIPLLTFHDPHILLVDITDGSGHETQVAGDVTVPLFRGAVYRDGNSEKSGVSYGTMRGLATSDFWTEVDRKDSYLESLQADE